jgi:hypothetical protein
MPGGRPIIDISGQRYGKLVALSVEKRTRDAAPRKPPLWTLRCDCGELRICTKGDLQNGRVNCCSTCAKRRQRELLASIGIGVKGSACVNHKHGAAGRGMHTKEYKAWASMIRRCEMPSQYGYEHYGGRGICVSPVWRHDFPAFLRDVGAAPTPSHTLERKNPGRQLRARQCLLGDHA